MSCRGTGVRTAVAWRIVKSGANGACGVSALAVSTCFYPGVERVSEGLKITTVQKRAGVSRDITSQTRPSLRCKIRKLQTSRECI